MMESNLLKTELYKNIKVGDVFDNPGGGTSQVVNINSEKIAYMRKKSRIYLPVQSFLDVYALFKGSKCSTNDLKKQDPRVFDSLQNGHSCNCTFLFRLAERLNLLEVGIAGKGKPGSPFYVIFK